MPPSASYSVPVVLQHEYASPHINFTVAAQYQCVEREGPRGAARHQHQLMSSSEAQRVTRCTAVSSE